jgi:putative thioredoxin
MANSPYVVDVTAENFQSVVLEGSRQRPVLVDYWADWCAPCRMLGPILDQLADQYGGKLLVAKVDTETQQELAAQFGIRSLPTVKLFKDGRPVDEFMGALPESEIRAFLDRHLPRESDALIDRAQGLLAAGDTDGAAQLIERARAGDAGNPRTLIAAAQLQAARGDFATAKQTLDTLPLDQQDDPEVQALRSRMAFDQVLSEAPPPAELEQRLAADPGDSEARYQLATHRIAAGDYEGALEQLFILLQKDRKYGDDAARKGMVQVFALLGGSGELVTRYRAKMMSALF